MPRETIYPSTPVENGSKVVTAEVSWVKECYVQLGVKHDEGSQGQSLWMDLDRSQINKLIRALRRARDQAYGRDE